MIGMEDKFLEENLYLFIGNLILYLLSYFLQFYLGHTFNPEEFGLIGTLFTIIIVITLLIYSLQITITQYISKNKENKIINQIIKHSLIIGSFIGLIILIFSPIISTFLNIEKYLFFWIAIIILAVMQLVTLRGILQGIGDYKRLSFSYILEGVFKLILGILFTVLGFKINGIMGALLATYFTSFLIIYFSLKKENETSRPIKEIYATLPYNFSSLLFLQLLGSIDLILVRHFLTPLETGYYTAISTLGRVIPYLSLTIGLVLLSKSVNNPNKKVLIKSIFLLLIISIPIIIIFLIFPELVIKLSFGSEYLEASKYLGLFVITSTLYSLVIIMSYYYMGIENKLSILITATFVLLQIILISLFHSSILEIILIMLIITSTLFLTLFSLVFFKKSIPKKENNKLYRPKK